MARIVVELTNRCNLRCQHCYAERHAATGDLPLEILDQVLREGKSCGIDQLAFTGGEPTLHRRFRDVVMRVSAAGYRFSLVSNGTQFPRVLPLLLQHQPWFTGVTFSLDGAREATHDRLRGQGTYRKVMQAMSACVIRQVPFAVNMVLTAQNRHEVAEMVDLADRLGSRGVRFGHLMPTPDTAQRGLDLLPAERRLVEAEIRALQPSAAITVALAPGYFSATPFFPCAPLELQECNLDYRGNLTLCCHLSGYAEEPGGVDVIGNLREMSLTEAWRRLRQRVATYLADKHDRVQREDLQPEEYFPCWYCVKYLNKVAVATDWPPRSWGRLAASSAIERNAHGAADAATP